ncbi:MAG: tandem-95 repeat protein [Nitrospira sp.]|nr:tandem-95 repeat protein [Nitrospira sp.]
MQLGVLNGTVTVTLQGGATISAGSNGTATLTLSGTQADLNATLATLSYQGTVNYTGADTLTVTSTDTTSASDVDTVAITVDPVNDAPTITNLSGDSLAYSEGDGAVVIEQGGNAVVADVDSADFNTGTLTVSFSAGSDSAEDVLSIRNQGTGAGQIGVSGSNVTYQGVTIGTVTGGSSGTNLVITFNGSATPTAVTALVQNITYQDTDTNAPTTGARTVRYVLTDGDGGTSANYDTTVTVSGVNDAPVNTVPGAQTVNEDTALALGGISVTDVDGNLSTVQLGVLNGTVTVTLQGGATISAGSNGTATLTLSGTQADLNATLATLSYQGTVNYTGADTLTVTSTDTTSASDVDTVAITVDPVNDAPVLDLDADNSSGATGANFLATFTEGAGAVAIVDADATLTDVDDALLSGLTASIDTLYDGASEQLTADVTGTSIAVAYDANTGVLTLSGSDTVAHYEQVLRTIRYQNTSDSPTTTSRTIYIRAEDGVAYSNDGTVNLTIVATNDAPAVDLNAGGAGQDVTTAFTEQTPVLIAPVGTLTDVDSATLTALTVMLTARLDGDGVESLSLNGAATTAASGASLTVNYTAATGVLSITGSATPAVYQTVLQGLLYNNTSDQPTPSNRSITVVAHDGTLPSATQTVTLTVAAVNDAPAGANGTITATEDTDYTFAPADFGFSDVDGHNLDRVWFTTVPAQGTLRWNGNTISANDFVVAWDIASGLVTYRPPADANGAALTSFTFQVQDDGGTANGGSDLDGTPNTLTIDVTAVNDAPVNTVPGAQTVNEDTALALGGISVTDVDGNLSTVQLGVGQGKLTVTLSGAATISAGSNGTATLTLSGTQADLNATLATLSYQGTVNYTGADTLTVTSTDTTSASDVDTVAITVDPVNDAPVNTVPGAQTVNEDTALALGGISVTDVDGNLSTVQLGVLNGTVTVTLQGGATISAGSNGTATLTLSGTQADLNATLATLSYQGTVNYTGADTLTVTSTDTTSASDVDTVAITVDPVNDAPVLATNGGATVAEGGTDSITTAELLVTDPDNTPVQLTYTVTIGPTNGQLELTTAPGIAITAFTQADINAGELVYVHDGSQTVSDSFVFTVNDGGGGSLGATTFNITVTPVNSPPTITSTSAYSVVENTTAVGSVTSSDPDGDVPTYSIVGGADAARFTINAATGDLAFVAAPDFEAPADANGDNVYLVQVQVADGNGGMAVQTVAVSVTDVLEGAITPPVGPPPSGGPPRGGEPPPGPPAPAPPSGPPAGSAATPEAGLPVHLDQGLSPGRPALLVAQTVDREPTLVAKQELDAPFFDTLGPELLARIGEEAQRVVEAVKETYIPAKLGRALVKELNTMTEALQRAMDERQEQMTLTAKTAGGVSLVLSVGYLAWLLRGGWLLASLLATMPTWHHFDPLPVVRAARRREKLERESSQGEGSDGHPSKNVDEMFGSGRG